MTEFDAKIAQARRWYLHMRDYEQARERYPMTADEVAYLVKTMETMQAEIIRLRKENDDETR